jgi:hypothetical protein
VKKVLFYTVIAIFGLTSCIIWPTADSSLLLVNQMNSNCIFSDNRNDENVPVLNNFEIERGGSYRVIPRYPINFVIKCEGVENLKFISVVRAMVENGIYTFY